MKNNKGITLIALIITIIVMLILATITLSFTIGDKGVIENAENAKVEQQRATERDRIQLAMADAQIKGMKEITWINFEDSLEKEFGDTAEIINERKDYFLVKVGENEYTAYKSGKVENEYKLIIEKYLDNKFDATFNTESNEVTNVKYKDTIFEGVVDFPDYIEKDGIKYKVIKIGYHYNYKFTEITLPITVEKIGDSINNLKNFHCCYNLKKVRMSKNIEAIGIECFLWCSALEDIIIPNGVKEIEDSAFSLCKSMENIIIAESVEKIGENVFYSCESLKRIQINKTEEEIKEKFSSLNENEYAKGKVYDIDGKLVTF